MRDKHELGRDDPRCDGSVSGDDCPQILLGELAREVKSFRINPLDVARRIDVASERRKHDHADRRGDQNTNTECPEQFGVEDPALRYFVRPVAHGSANDAARQKDQEVN